MCIFKKKKILITHNGAFHTDDLFAAATLSILNDGRVKIIRTRDPKVFEKGDYVFDVGGEYNEVRNRFDHHQKGGAGTRGNGIPYSSFGLVWKKYGEQICGSKEVAKRIEQKIVMPIDAIDNGVDIIKPIFENIFPYSVEDIFLSEFPTWKEDNSNIDIVFNKQVKKIISLINREIKIAKDDLNGINKLIEFYNKSEDKKVIVSDFDFPRYLLQDTLSRFSEPMYFIYPSSKSNTWKVEAIKKNPSTLESRKLFPQEWRGIMESSGKLREITGVPDAQFCHASGFFLTVGSKEGAIALAEKALLS